MLQKDNKITKNLHYRILLTTLIDYINYIYIVIFDNIHLINYEIIIIIIINISKRIKSWILQR